MKGKECVCVAYGCFGGRLRTHPLAAVEGIEGRQAAQADAAAVEDGEESGGGEGPDVGAGALQQHPLLQQHTAPSAHAAERGKSIQ